MLLFPRDPQPADPPPPPSSGLQTVIAMEGFDLRDEDFQSFSPLSAPVQTVDNIDVWLADCLKCKPAQR